MTMNMDALYKIRAEMAGAAKVNAALEEMRKLTQKLTDTQAKGATANNQAIQQTIQLNQRLAQATTAAGIDINNAEKQILSSKLQHVKTDKERQAIQDQLASLEIKNARMRRQSTENELSAELKLAEKKREAIQIELKRAQAAVATAGKYGKITPEIMRQAEAARRNLDLANQEVRVTSQIAAEKRKVADAQLRATEAQAQMSRAVDTTKGKMSQLQQVVSAIGIADLARRMGEFSRASLAAGEQSGLVGMRIKNLAGQFGETAAVTRLAADSAKRYGLSSIEASEGVANLYGRLRPLGIGLADIESTFIGVNNAAKAAGLTTYDAKEAFLQLGQAMGSGRLQGEELGSLMERMPAIGRAIVDTFNDIARSKGLEQISKEKADVLIKQTKEGEKRQTEILKEQAGLRIEALRDETEKHLGEIDKRYRRQRQLMEDRFEDQDDAVRRSNDRQLDATIDGISERADVERKAIERRFEDRRKIVEDDKTINDAQKTQLLRNLEDEKSAVLKAIQDREDAATTQVRDAADARNRDLSRINRDARQAATEQLQAAQQKEEDAVKASMERQKASLEAKLKSDVEATKRATAETLANLVASTRVTVGDLKQMGADGIITTDILVMAMKKLEQITPPPPTAMQQFTAAMADLRMELGEGLLPLLTPAITVLTGMLKAFNALPDPVKAVAGGVLFLAGALADIALPLAGFAAVINLLAGAGAWTAITGGLGAIAAFLVSWPVLLVAAGVAIFLFRDQIYAAVDGINKSIQSTFRTIIDLIRLDLEIIGKAVYGAVDGINKSIREGITITWKWLGDQFNSLGGMIRKLYDGAVSLFGKIGDAIKAPFKSAIDWIRSALNSVLSAAGKAVNGFIDGVNQLIAGVNKAAAAVRMPQLPYLPSIQVPQFATGAYVSGPTVAQVGEAGAEYVIPANRMGAASQAYLQGARGIDVVNGRGGQASAPSINITTGPVYRLHDNTDTVSMADFHAGLQSVATGIMSQLRTPAGRMALRGA